MTPGTGPQDAGMVTSETTNGSAAKVKVLVADDEQVIANTLAAILNGSGFEAQTVYNGRAAVDALSSFDPDLFISDVVMPEMTGIEAAIEIKAQRPRCKVLLFSGQAATADLLREAEAQGHCFEILAKPVHPTDLLAKLRSVEFREMGASHSNSHRLLMYGRDPMLLNVRSLVLSQAGFDVTAVETSRELEEQIAAKKRHYDLLVLCHTVQQEERDSLNVIATQSRVPVYQLDPFVNAPDLIGQVSRLLT
jgi:DNA-binding response OmpR family regulator